MTLALIILAGISAFVFIAAFGRIIVAAFQHHIITGLISFLPGINLVVLPSIWDKVGRSFITSALSLAFALLTWYAGGNNYLSQKNIIANTQQDKKMESSKEELEITKIPHSPLGRIKEVSLPQKPLHYLIFVDTPKQKYSSLNSDYLRVTLLDDSIVEGKSSEKTAEIISVEERYQGTTRTQQIKIANIKKLQILTVQ